MACALKAVSLRKRRLIGVHARLRERKVVWLRMRKSWIFAAICYFPLPSLHGWQSRRVGPIAFSVPDRLIGLSNRFNAEFRVKCPNPCFSK